VIALTINGLVYRGATAGDCYDLYLDHLGYAPGPERRRIAERLADNHENDTLGHHT
jgi:hypothetical protein